MKRLSIPEHFDIRNTGLRPNWNSFWGLEGSDASDHWSAGFSQRTQEASVFSTKSQISGGTISGIKHVRFVTGSEWIGEWDRSGMSGMGLYKMPHGVVYEGTMKAGLFEGIGVLKYPNGSCLEGLWYQGKLKYWQYDYADGLERDCQHWTYCSMPDRRFYSEHEHGFRPATTEHITNEHPPRDVPPGHYDVGLGFFNPKSHCVVDAVTGEVLSIPTASEEKWILENCRTGEPTETIGFRPDLYENLFKKSTEEARPAEVRSLASKQELYNGDMSGLGSYLQLPKYSDSEYPLLNFSDLESKAKSAQPQQPDNEYATAEREILLLIQQEGAKLQSLTSFAQRRLSLFDKLEKNSATYESITDQPTSRATSFEGLLKKIAKEIELNIQSIKSSDDSGTRDDLNSTGSNLHRLTQIINAYAEITYRKKTASSSVGSTGALEQFRIIGKCFPSLSLTKHYLQSESSLGSDSDMVHRLIYDRILNKDHSMESMVSSTNY